MPKLSELTDAYTPQEMLDGLPVESPFVSVPVDADGVRRVRIDTVAPKPYDNLDAAIGPSFGEGVAEHPLVKQLFGLGGETRYQLWPERMVREGLSAAGDVMSGKVPQWAVDPESGDVHTSPNMVEKAQEMSALAGTGGLAGMTTDATLGATPFLRPALKYKDKLYKGKDGQQHLDVIPASVYPEFQRQAMSGEDISNFQFGFVNEKGHFLDREKALKHAIDTGLVDPQAAQYGALTAPVLERMQNNGSMSVYPDKGFSGGGLNNILTTQLLADSSKPGIAIEAMKTGKVPAKDFLKVLEAHDATLPPEAQSAISKFVGGPHDTFAKGIESGIMNADPLEVAYGAKSKYMTGGHKDSALVKEQLEAAAAPIREALRREHGDTITLFRTQGEIPKDAQPRKVLSMTADEDFAHSWAGVKKVRGLYTDEEIQAARKKLDETGEAEAGNYILKKSEHSPKYYDLHSKKGEYLTDSGGPEELLMHENEWLKQLHATNADKSKKVGKYEIPVDNVVWYTNRFGQKEFIVKNDENLRKIMLKADNEAGMAIQANKPAFFSAVEHNVNAIPQAKMTGDQWLGTLSNKPGVKPEEMQWTGLQDFLMENKGKPVTKEQIQEHLNNNKVELKEVNKGGETPWAVYSQDDNKVLSRHKTVEEADAEVAKRSAAGERRVDSKRDDTKYHGYQLAGGENYREMLLTLPDKTAAAKAKFAKGGNQSINSEERDLLSGASGNYKSSHWDEPNILAHVRMNDRTIDGKKSLHLEEVQSDWGQAGREKGFRPEQEKRMASLVKDRDKLMAEAKASDEARKPNASYSPEDFKRIDDLNVLHDKINDLGRSDVGVPDMPFKKTWHELALKRMLREASEKGYDRLSWTSGEHHPTNPKNLKQSGPEADRADRGMQGFYNDILPKSVEKLGKEYGVKVKTHELETNPKGWHITPPSETVSGKWMVKSSDYNSKGWHFDTKAEAEANLAQNIAGEKGTKKIHYIDIPDKMKDAALSKGFPLFSSGGYMLMPIDFDPFADKK